MKTKNNIFEDLARVSTNVATLAFESAKTVQEGINSKAQSMAKKADLVARDEFDVIKSAASKIKLENESIIKDISDYKKQIQTVVSSVDLIKEQVNKALSANNKNSGEEKKFFEALKKNNDEILQKLKKLEDVCVWQSKEIKAQQRTIDELAKNLNQKTEEIEELKKIKVVEKTEKVEKLDKNKVEKPKQEKAKEVVKPVEEAQDSLFG